MRISMVIPAFDEEGAIGDVVSGFLSVERDGKRLLEELVVADNRSTDRTAEIARQRGATVVREERPGYGSACLRGLAHLRERPSGPPEIVVFADGDGSNDPSDLLHLVQSIEAGESDLVIGARTRTADPGSLNLPQRFGNALATRLMNALYHVHYTDLGPFRAIRWPALERIEMQDPNYGWTVEMQIKAAKSLRIREIDVKNHARTAGKSKVSGTVRGVVGAGVKILSTIARYR
jgi:glycosyltransferase involved in cell wall biosynthesis